MPGFLFCGCTSIICYAWFPVLRLHVHNLLCLRFPFAQLVPTLARGIKAFMTHTAEYLNAYVSRRQQLLEVRDTYKDRLHNEIETRPGFDFIRMVVKGAPNDNNLDSEDEDGTCTMRGSTPLTAERAHRHCAEQMSACVYVCACVRLFPSFT